MGFAKHFLGHIAGMEQVQMSSPKIWYTFKILILRTLSLWSNWYRPLLLLKSTVLGHHQLRVQVPRPHVYRNTYYSKLLNVARKGIIGFTRCKHAQNIKQHKWGAPRSRKNDHYTLLDSVNIVMPVFRLLRQPLWGSSNSLILFGRKGRCSWFL